MRIPRRPRHPIAPPSANAAPQNKKTKTKTSSASPRAQARHAATGTLTLLLGHHDRPESVEHVRHRLQQLGDNLAARIARPSPRPPPPRRTCDAHACACVKTAPCARTRSTDATCCRTALRPSVAAGASAPPPPPAVPFRRSPRVASGTTRHPKANAYGQRATLCRLYAAVRGRNWAYAAFTEADAAIKDGVE